MINSPADFAFDVRVRGNAGWVYFTSAAKLGYVHFVIVCVLEIKLGGAFINNGRMHRSRGAGARGQALQTSMPYRMKYASAA